jgi:xanthine dehydrogenase YagS FAD-binding subunit
MNRFSYARATDVSDALAQHQGAPHVAFLAGGTNLVDLIRMNVERPDQLIDITRLPLKSIDATPDGGLRIGALVTNSVAARDRTIVERYPLLTKAILAGASAQIRNAATIGGNLLQRTRCHYFYDPGLPCNKREPGSGCPALDGVNRMHAILGASAHCIAVHPSDMCVALAALDATVHAVGSTGPRAIPFADFHRLPGDTPHRDANLEPGEIVTAVELPAAGFASHHAYLKIRERASYAFALVSVALAVELDGDVMRDVRCALGGVAHKPWRDFEAEAMLRGAPLSANRVRGFAGALVRNAHGRRGNAFKIELVTRAVVRAFQIATQRDVRSERDDG